MKGMIRKYFTDANNAPMPRFVSPIFDILAVLINYSNSSGADALLPITKKDQRGRNIEEVPSGNEARGSVKPKMSLLFMIMFTQFTLEQGEAIVTSLEHLLFEFLNQIPGGIDNFNANIDKKISTMGDDSLGIQNERSKKFVLATGNSYVERSFNIESSSGMTESVIGTYLGGMNNVLDINENSRFINLLTILRRKKAESDTNKRCQGARDTLEFGTTLVQANSDLCGEQGALKSENQEERNERNNIIKLLSEINTAKQGLLSDSIVQNLKTEVTGLGIRGLSKYTKNMNLFKRLHNVIFK